MAFKIIFISFAALAVLFFTTLLVCFLKVFYSPKRKPLGENEYAIPEGEIYEAFRNDIIGWTNEARTLPHENVEITSHDGLTLRGKYYEYKKGAPIEILFHGYRGTGERDMCAGISRCFAVGRSALVVDQRASGFSDGSVISFGINERLDCLRWVDFAVKKFGEDCLIILTGISMGAATVMMASSEPLPKNVVCILADCGFSSPEAVIRKVMKDIVGNTLSKICYLLGFRGSYHRMSGTVLLEKFYNDTIVESIESKAMWEQMCFGKDRIK